MKSAKFENEKGTVDVQGDEIALVDKGNKANLTAEGLTISDKDGANGDKTRQIYVKDNYDIKKMAKVRQV